MALNESRPTGITILAILFAISGVIYLVLGLGFSTFLVGLFWSFGVAWLASAFVGIFVAFGVISFVMAVGMLRGRPLIRKIAIIFSIVNLVFGDILGIVIIYYLTRPHVKDYFNQESDF